VKPLVLIGCAEASAAIEATWSLQAAGFDVLAFRRAANRSALRRVRGVEIEDVAAPENDALATIADVQRLIDERRPSAVLPLDDHALWVCNRLERDDVRIAGATGAQAEYALDKAMQIGAAARAGLAVPETQIVDDPGDAEPDAWPVVVKSARAVLEVGGKIVRPTGVICSGAGELQAASIRQWHGQVLVQPLIRGVGEGVFGHLGGGAVIAWSGHQRVRMVNPQGSGSSACRSCDVDEQLLEPSRRFLEAIGWRGMFMLEFLRGEDGTPWFMELNGRAWGSMALARRRGFEYPAWTVRAALEPDFEPDPPQHAPQIECRNLGLDIVHLMFVARGPQSAAALEWPRFGRAFVDVVRHRPGDRYYNWNPAQPSVFVADTVGTLAEYLRKTVRRPA
jgi:hypothetical protein